MNNRFSSILYEFYILSKHPELTPDRLASELQTSIWNVYKWIEGVRNVPMNFVPQIIAIHKKYDHGWKEMTDFILRPAGLIATEIRTGKKEDFKKEALEAIKESAEAIKALSRFENPSVADLVRMQHEIREALKELAEVDELIERKLNEESAS